MSERLIVKNFGPIVEADLEIRRIMLFIGPQASGKSTITKLIAIFREIKFVLEDKKPNKDFLSFFRQYNLSSYFKGNDTAFSYECPKYKITYVNSKWDFYISEAFELEIKTEDERIRDLIRVVVKNQAAKNVAINNEEQYFNMLFQSNRSNLFSLLNRQVYIPAERTLVSMVDDSSFFYKDVPLPECFVDFGKKFQGARNNHKSYKIDFLGIEYKFVDGKNKVFYSDQNSLLLSESASGFQAIIPMMLVVYALKDGHNSYIVEEPELNLFPKTQYDVVKFLVSNCNEESDLVITTHSPYMLSVLNNLLFSYMVAHGINSNSDKIKDYIPEDMWINPSDFNAYYATGDTFKSIFNQKTGLISDNELDNISEEISNQYNYLYELYKSQ